MTVRSRDPLEPAQERRDGAWIVAYLVPGGREQVQLGSFTSGSGDRACRGS